MAGSITSRTKEASHERVANNQVCVRLGREHREREQKGVIMKNPNKLYRPLAVILGLLISASGFAGDVLPHRFNGTWFRMRMNARGRTLDPDTGHIARRNLTQRFYLQMVPTATQNEYRLFVWTRNETGWTNSSTSTEKTIGPRESFISDCYLQIFRNSSNNVETFSTPYITSSTNSVGGIRRADWRGVGEVYDGMLGMRRYFGNASFHGTRIPASSLPFTPVL
jgi:hypothetical protein